MLIFYESFRRVFKSPQKRMCFSISKHTCVLVKCKVFQLSMKLVPFKVFFVRVKCRISFLLCSLTITMIVFFVCHPCTCPLCLVSRITIVTWFKFEWYEKEICVGLVYWITTPFYFSHEYIFPHSKQGWAVIKASSVSGWSFRQKIIATCEKCSTTIPLKLMDLPQRISALKRFTTRVWLEVHNGIRLIKKLPRFSVVKN